MNMGVSSVFSIGFLRLKVFGWHDNLQNKRRDRLSPTSPDGLIIQQLLSVKNAIFRPLRSTVRGRGCWHRTACSGRRGLAGRLLLGKMD